MMAANQIGDDTMRRDEVVVISRGQRRTGDVMNISTVPGQCCPIADWEKVADLPYNPTAK